MYQWLVFLHILGVFGFLLAHGSATAISFKLRGEREVARIRALLDLSRSTGAVGGISLLVMLAAGITLGFMGDWWGRGWIWVSLGVLVLIGFSMTLVGSRPLNRIRAVVGTALSKQTDTEPGPDAAVDQQLAVLLGAIRPWLLTAIGGGGLAIILWLMMFKPF